MSTYKVALAAELRNHHGHAHAHADTHTPTHRERPTHPVVLDGAAQAVVAQCPKREVCRPGLQALEVRERLVQIPGDDVPEVCVCSVVGRSIGTKEGSCS